ncbi:brain tumor protein-like [Lineus longissimus]|uniref:brain tumor protein-like n=1 Tax=Lineus longissimus TaxID=88925 RepID=UPI002B4D0E9E
MSIASAGSDAEDQTSLEAASPVICEEQTCSLCEEKYKTPKLLNCLHEFCQQCLEKHLEEQESINGPKILTCPTCQQETNLYDKGILGLPLDIVMVNMMDMSAVQQMQIVCTSCKAKEKAVARCSDCANFLCPNCVTAHQYMRCFENHKVVSFEDLQNEENNMSLHKPVYCPRHPAENMKYFCNTCQTPMCNDCILGDHKPPEHHYERIADIEAKQVEEIKNLMQESRSKTKFCEDASNNLTNSLSELQLQRDNAKGLIQETFQSYKAILEKVQEETLKDLEDIHSKEEMKLMEMINNVEKTVERVEDGCKFAERILEKGNSLEISMMKSMISSQLLSLINNTPKGDANTSIEFVSSAEKFEDAVKKNFGQFKKEPERVDTQHSSLQSSFENEAGFSLPSGMLNHEDSPPLPPRSTAHHEPFLPPHLSLPLALSLPNTMSPPPMMPGIQSMGTAIIGCSSELRTYSRNSHSPAMSDSGVSLDASSGGSGNNTPQVNLAQLAKMGNVGVNASGQITLNGQILSGLNLSNVTGGGMNPAALKPIGEDRGPPPVSGLNLAPRAPSPPTLDCLANLLNQQNSFGNLPPVSSSSGTITPTCSMFSSQSPRFSAGMNQSTTPPGGDVFSNMTDLSVLSQFTSASSSSGSGGGMSGANPPFARRSGGKVSAMQIGCKFGQLGPGKGQFNSPHGFCLGTADEDIVVADTNNHRIQVFEKTGEFKYQFGIPGREEGQLWYPRKVAVFRASGKYVVCDRGNERSRMQIFTKNGHFIKKIAIRYIDIVAGLALTPQGHIVAVDSVSPTVFCIAESGDLLRWFDCSDYMREPSDIAIDGKEYFVCDFKGHCVVVFSEEGQFLRRIGCENITNFPNGIDISDAGDVLVGDSHGNRFHVAVFQRDGSLIGEFECPYVKVSRCCGLKITAEGYIVTLAKNNHHVLVLNTLYIT